MDDVMCDARVVRVLGEERFEDPATVALIGEGFVGFRSGDGERERRKNGSAAEIEVDAFTSALLMPSSR